MSSQKLFPYQEEVIAEALDKKRFNPKINGLCLCVPMGFGKTNVSLNLAVLTKTGLAPTLVICSKTLITNWRDEIKKFFGDDLKFEILHGDYMKNIQEWIPNSDTDIVITTSEVASKSYDLGNVENSFVYKASENGDFSSANVYHQVTGPWFDATEGIGLLHSTHWDNIIIDECQDYTNIKSKKAKSIASLAANFRWCLSGTLLQEIDIDRMLGLFLLINAPYPRDIPSCKNFLHSRSKFGGFKDFCVERKTMPVMKAPLPKLYSKVVSFPLDKNEVVCFTMLQKIIVDLWNRYKDSVSARNVTETRRIGGHLLAMISYLRQSLVISQLAICKLISRMDVDHDDVECIKRLVEATFVKHGLKEWIENPESKKSSRIKACLDIVEKHEKDVILVFCSYVTCLQYLKKVVETEFPNIQTFLLTSTLTTAAKDKTLEDFKKTTSSSILFSTYMTSGQGLNLQNSNVVINLDLYWNSGKEKQSLARMYRTGQSHSEVYQYILISNTGLEKEILKKQKSKLELIDEFMNGQITSDKAPSLSLKDIVKIVSQEDTKVLADSFKI